MSNTNKDSVEDNCNTNIKNSLDNSLDTFSDISNAISLNINKSTSNMKSTSNTKSTSNIKANATLDLRTPKGTLDYSSTEALTINSIISDVENIFKLHNAVPLITPTFELRQILMNKYGDDAKLIYNIEDQGGDICSLRYDLTVPLSRFIASNRIQKLRRYQIGSVFRRDNPSFKTGRLREFIQADFDICGDNLKMMNDAEILKIIDSTLKINISGDMDYIIKINDRRIIMGMLEMAGVPSEIHSLVCSSIDKADKLTENELLVEFKGRGLAVEQIDFIMQFINKNKCINSGDYCALNIDSIAFLENMHSIYIAKDNANNSVNNSVKDNVNDSVNNNVKDNVKDNAINNTINNAINNYLTAIQDLKLLIEYINIYCIKNVKIDFSLARGLDYYTGIIIEASIIDKNKGKKSKLGDISAIGSVIGGGRYDNLCSSISKHPVPCIGFSVGISRLYTIKKIKEKLCIPQFEVFVGSGYGVCQVERMQILNILWDNGFKAETFSGKRVFYNGQLEYARKNNFKVMIMTGENEHKVGILNIVDPETGNKITIKFDEMLEVIKKRLE